MTTLMPSSWFTAVEILAIFWSSLAIPPLGQLLDQGHVCLIDGDDKVCLLSGIGFWIASMVLIRLPQLAAPEDLLGGLSETKLRLLSRYRYNVPQRGYCPR